MHLPGERDFSTWRALVAVAPGLLLSVTAQAQYFTDTGSPANPAWSTLKPTLNQGTADPGPVPGSVINVNNALTEVGLYGNRSISAGTLRLHCCCNTSATNLTNFTRWYQTDGNTQVFRLFVNDANTADSRVGAARVEAFTYNSWTAANNTTYEWSGHYTIAHQQQGPAIFQVKNDDNDWAVQVDLGSNGDLIVNNRRNASDVTVTNPDGTAKDFDGQGFDLRVQDDGLNYKLWINGVLLASNYYSRPTGGTHFRWGMYYGDRVVTAPADYSLIMVSGAQVMSWSGNLESAITTIKKANNTQNLDTTGSWSGSVLPGLYQQALWDSTVTSANTTTLNSAQVWSGIKIANPGGQVTMNGTALLGLDSSGLDMSTATQNLVVNCPVELRVTQPWNIAASRSATFAGVVKGYGGITLGGSGTLILNNTNSYTGPTVINGGTLAFGVAAPFANTSGISMVNGTLLQPTIGGATIANPITISGTNATVAISAPTNLPGGGVVSTFTLGGALSGNGNVTFTSSANQNALSTVVLNAQNTYTGNTLLDTAGTAASQLIVRLGKNNALPVSTVLTIDGQTGQGTGRFAELNLNGFGQELAGLTNVPRTLRVQRIVNSDVSSPATLTINNVNNYTFSGNLGGAANGSVSASAMPGSTGGNNFALTKKGAGTFTLSNVNTYTGATNVSGGTLALTTTGALPINSALIIGNGGTVLAVNHGTTPKVVLQTGTLSIATGGRLDLSNNDFVARNTSAAAITTQVKNGYAGNWQGTSGISSSAAAGDTTHLTALGAIQNSINGLTAGTALYSTFDGASVANTDVLVKYTYYGDTNLDGQVDGTDYSRIDGGYLNHTTGWFNGDLNYDGVVNGTDYTLMDNSFNRQGTRISASIADPQAVVTAAVATSGSTSSVPEPAALAMLTLATAAQLSRRRHR